MGRKSLRKGYRMKGCSPTAMNCEVMPLRRTRRQGRETKRACLTTGPSRIIQKHYEFYLANKIYKVYPKYSVLLRLSARATLAVAIALALHADIIAQHGPEYEVLLGGELAERLRNKEADGLQAFAPPEEEVQAIVAHRLHEVVDALTV